VIKKYSEQQIKSIWEKAKPKKIEDRLGDLEEFLEKRGISSLLPELNILKSQVVDLQERVERLEGEHAFREVIIRKFSRKKTKEMIANYLRKKGEAFPSDVADDLGLSIVDVMEAMKALKKEKKVEEVR